MLTSRLSVPTILATFLAFSTVLSPSRGPWAETAPADVDQPPLIARRQIFGNPQRGAARLSPNGQWLSWTAPSNGVMNVWVAPIGKPEQAKVVTHSPARPVSFYFWSTDSKRLLYLQDANGDENFMLYCVGLDGKPERNLTPFPQTQAQVIASSHQVPGEILVGLNKRDPKWHDVYRLNLESGQLTEVFRADGFKDFVADDRLELRLASKPNAEGGVDYYHVKANVADSKPYSSKSLSDDLTTRPLGYSFDGKTLYWLDSRNRDTAALYAEDCQNGQRKLLGQNERADIQGLLTNPQTGEAEAYATNYTTNEWIFLNSNLRDDWKLLNQKLGGVVFITSRDDKDHQWIVGNDPITAPSAYYLYDRQSKRLEKLYLTRPELSGAPLVPMHPLELKSRDGLPLVSYLTLPKQADSNGDGRPERTSPMVLLVHGGPWGRDNYGYNPTHQWLANRGYAVLSVNFRGSTGFGKRFTNAGDLQWGRQMQDDLLDAVDWAVKNNITRADQVAIMGGSYGGYATLAGLAFTPKVFACGVDIVGPSNLQTLLKTIPPYWAAELRQMYRRMGDPTTDEGSKLLAERSPVNFAGQIVKPLLIGQGANDPRVKQAESDQIVGTMKSKNIPVTYVLFPDEGHGFRKPVNSIAFNAVVENFLSKFLGGRAEPIGDSLKSSSGKVVEGASLVPGLSE